MPTPLKTSNFALGPNTFRGQYAGYGNTMTMDGTVNKTGILLVLCMLSAFWTWHSFTVDGPEAIGLPMMAGLIGGFITALITIFKKEWSPVTAPIYALSEGLVLGGISAMLNQRYPGVAFQAVCLTFGTLFVLLFAYRARIIKVTEKFMLGVVAATGAVALFYLAEMILGFFHIQFLAINGSGVIGIGFSLVVVVIAALNLVLDFAFIEQGVTQGAPKYMEWYGGFSLMVTLVWLYLEILRLLTKLQRRN